LAHSDPSGPISGARAGNTLLALGSRADLPSAPSNLEVMEIDKDPVGEFNEDPAIGSDPLPDWRISYHD
jgi:hypothetical protein